MSERAPPSDEAFWADTTDEVALQRCRTLVHTIDDGIYQLDAAGRFEAVNDVILEYTGYTREDLLGEHVSLVLRDADIDRIGREIDRRFTTGERRHETFEFAVRTADGETVPCELRLSLLVEDGAFQGTVGVVRTIADRNRTAQTLDERDRALRRERDLTEQILETSPVGILVLDADGEITRMNERARALLGVSDEQEAYSPSDRPVFDEAGRPVSVDAHPFAVALETGEPVYDRILEVDRPDGDSRWLSVSAVPLTDADGEVDRVVTTGEDVTALKERERSLARQTDDLATELEEIYGRITDGVMALNDAWEFTHVNEHAAEILGVERAAVLGTSLWETFPDVRGTELDDRYREAMETQAPRSFDGYYEPFGIWVEMRIYPSETGLSLYFRDVTDRKTIEREIDATNRTLQRLYAISADRERSFDDKVTAMLALGRERLGVETGYLATVDEAADHFEVTHASSNDPRVHSGAVAPLSETYCQTTVETNGLLAFTDAPTDHGIGATVYEDWELDCYVGGSVIVDDDRYGTLCFEDETPRDTPFTQAERTFVELVTQWVSYELERTQHQRALERATEYTDEILDAVDDVFCVLDANGNLRRWNETIAEVTGYAHDELASMNVLDFFDEAGHAAIARAIADGFETGRTGVEAELRTKDGTSIPYEFAATTLTDPDGESRLAGIGRDITERKAHQRQLAESERRYRTLVEHFPHGAVALFDDDFRYTAVGGQLMDATGVAPDERLGNSIYELYPEDVVDEIRPYFTAALAGESNSFELEYHNRHLLAYTLPIRDADDEVYAGMLVVQDITDLKETQRKLEASNERLEQFAYAASHDLQEPLRMVSSYLQLIEQRYADALDADGREFLAFAVDGAERMNAMIDGLLAYSRIETRGNPFEPVALDDILADVREDLRVRIAEHDAEITADALPRVEGDASQLRQLFQNLLDNAIEYSGDEPPCVHVSAERAGDDWIISVRDEGIGIDPSEQVWIFEMFQRLHGRDEHPGTGIGLALCRRIAERHAGDLWVDSEPDAGSTFSVTLPASGHDA